MDEYTLQPYVDKYGRKGYRFIANSPKDKPLDKLPPAKKKPKQKETPAGKPLEVYKVRITTDPSGRKSYEFYQ